MRQKKQVFEETNTSTTTVCFIACHIECHYQKNISYSSRSYGNNNQENWRSFGSILEGPGSLHGVKVEN